jgi:hypothetical protein
MKSWVMTIQSPTTPKNVRDGAVEALPTGYTAVENARTGLLVLKKLAK